MTEGETLILLLLLAPALASGMCLLLRRPKAIVAIVILTSLLLMASSAALIAYLFWNALPSIAIDSAAFYPMSLLVLLLDFALLVTFLVIGFRERSWPVILLSLAQVLPLVWFEYNTFGQEFEPSLIVDMLSMELILITSFVGSIICIYALRYMSHDPRQPSFFAVMLVFLAAMNGAVMCNNLSWLLVFWEATTLCSYLLIRHERTPEAKASALRALVYTLGGGVAFVIGIILVYEESGALLLSTIGGTLLSGLALLPIGLMAIAAFTKSAQLPFQNWLLGAMVAPTPVSALLHSSTMVNLGVYFLLRLSYPISSVPGLSWAVALVGAVSFAATAVLAIANNSSKRVLAYSTIGNLGLIVLCAAIGTKESLYAGSILLLFHAVSKALLFLAVGVVKHDTGSDDIENMSGLRGSMPFVTFCLLVGVVTILLPPFGAFASKWTISELMVDYPFIAILLAIGIGASVVFYFKWLGRAYALGPQAQMPPTLREKLPPAFKWTMLALALGAVALSFLLPIISQYLLEPWIGPLPPDALLPQGIPLIPILVLVIIVGLAMATLVRAPEKAPSTPYTGGEPFRFELAGAYYFTGKSERSLTIALNAITTVLLVLLLMVPLLQEVGAWSI